MLNVALTGNIAAGKSTVVDLFRRWGATIIDADALVREAQAPGGAVLAAIAGRFGADVLASDGTLDRSALRGKVMGDQAALDALNQIVHPAVRRRRDELLREAREAGDLLVVNDIPLLFEALDPTQFDAVVLVDAGAALRRTRLRTLRGLSNDEADRMIAAQMPAERKRAKSDFVIENEGSLKRLERQARAAFDELRHRAAVGALGGRPARVLLLAAAESREQPTLNPIAARYAEAGLAVRRVSGPRSRRRWVSPRCPTRSSRPPRPRRPRNRPGGARAVRACSPPSPTTPTPLRYASISGRGAPAGCCWSSPTRRAWRRAPICFQLPTRCLDRASVPRVTFAATSSAHE